MAEATALTKFRDHHRDRHRHTGTDSSSLKTKDASSAQSHSSSGSSSNSGSSSSSSRSEPGQGQDNSAAVGAPDEERAAAVTAEEPRQRQIAFVGDTVERNVASASASASASAAASAAAAAAAFAQRPSNTNESDFDSEPSVHELASLGHFCERAVRLSETRFRQELLGAEQRILWAIPAELLMNFHDLHDCILRLTLCFSRLGATLLRKHQAVDRYRNHRGQGAGLGEVIRLSSSKAHSLDDGPQRTGMRG